MIAFILFIIGLAIGSFISASVWRFHEQSKLDDRQQTPDSRKEKKKHSSSSQLPTPSSNDLSILKGRSMCEHCGHTLSALDLVPLFSWLSLGGKCRYCKAKLSWEYPAVEAASGLLFVLSYVVWDFNGRIDYVSFGFWLIFLSALIFLAIYDLKWLLLPNRIVYPMIFGVAIMVIVESIFFDGGQETIKDSFAGALFIGGIFYMLFAMSKGRWIGGGDVKLGVFIGLLLGFSRSALAFVLAFNIAALVILPLLLLKVVNRKTPIPFGPFLILATIISALYGYDIIQWYSDYFLYGLI